MQTGKAVQHNPAGQRRREGLMSSVASSFPVHALLCSWDHLGHLSGKAARRKTQHSTPQNLGIMLSCHR